MQIPTENCQPAEESSVVKVAETSSCNNLTHGPGAVTTKFNDGGESQQPAAAAVRDKPPSQPMTDRPHHSPRRRLLSQDSFEHPKKQRQVPQQCRRSYEETDLDQEMCVEPLPVQMSAMDNDMWVKVKYENLGRRSSSSSNLTTIVSGSEGDGKLIIKASTSAANRYKIKSILCVM